MAEEDRDRPHLAGERVLDRELRRLHRLERLMRLHDLFGDAAKGAAGVPAAVIAGRLLIGRVQMEMRRVGEIGQQHHRRRRQKRLQRADQPVAEHPRPLPDHHAGPPGEPAVNLGHDPGERFLAHRDHAHLVLHLGESRDDAPGMPAGNAEDIFDAGLGQDPRHQYPRRCLLFQHPLDRHDILPGVCGSLLLKAGDDNGWLDDGAASFEASLREAPQDEGCREAIKSVLTQRYCNAVYIQSSS